MNIRRYTPEDLEAVVKLFRSNLIKFFVEAEEKELRDFLAEYSEDYFVVEIIDEIVAAGGIALNADRTISLCWAMVRNDLIGTGLGKQLTLFRMEKGREKWGDLPFFTSTSQHTEGFYTKLGFHTVEHIPNGFGSGIDTCKMRREPITSPPVQVQAEVLS
ncbi:MAG: GNAT family N-acetyltransferase [Pyrinomonadaceae bacterium]|nr:GNAT family N-acetyltransferase [Pyrinomonadaceae bacterium]